MKIWKAILVLSCLLMVANSSQAKSKEKTTKVATSPARAYYNKANQLTDVASSHMKDLIEAFSVL